jgi:hypothetical protein
MLHEPALEQTIDIDFAHPGTNRGELGAKLCEFIRCERPPIIR